MTVVIYSLVANAYIVDCDVDKYDGRGFIETGPLDRARQFMDAADALLYWKRQSRVRPMRLDGKPNRPLTAHSVEIIPLDQAKERAR